MDNENTTPEASAEAASPVDVLVMQCREIIECDAARITKPGNTMFLIIGFNRDTKEDDGQWYKNGSTFDFSYLDERVVASGVTEKELLDSVEEYKRIRGLTMDEYLIELTA